MLAEASAVAIAIPAVSFAAIIGVYIILLKQKDWVSKHMSDQKIHAEKQAIVYKDVCQTTHRLENEKADERHAEVKADLAEIKTMLQNR